MYVLDLSPWRQDHFVGADAVPWTGSPPTPSSDVDWYEIRPRLPQWVALDSGTGWFNEAVNDAPKSSYVA